MNRDTAPRKTFRQLDLASQLAVIAILTVTSSLFLLAVGIVGNMEVGAL